ncbi:MAG: DUF2000 domain-containing protein [Candidatus Peregrinibacteria bacterium]|nr:DUF2000 domain-containing protein [Candidatus Peregrinibacteria bacterium]
MSTLPNETTKRFVAVLNKKIEAGKLMNALGHMTAGFAANYPNIEELGFLQYQDKDGGVHPNISHYPFIVLQADNGNQIRALRNELQTRGIPFIDFTSTMTVGTSAEQVERTQATPEAELEYWGICTFGSAEVLKPLTKKFSMFRSGTPPSP